MKLNNDLIRDILLTVEEFTSYDKPLSLYKPYEVEENNQPFIKNYSKEELFYHLKQCELSGLIEIMLETGEYTTISYLTPEGHLFLENIRSDTVWNKTKTIAQKLGLKSLDAIIQISSNVITQIIKQELGY